MWFCSISLGCGGANLIELFSYKWSIGVNKDFSIIAVGNENFFEDGNIPKIEKPTDKMILRAETKERPIRNGKQITVGDKYYIIK